MTLDTRPPHHFPNACVWLPHWARVQPERVAFRMLALNGGDSRALTYAELDLSARRVASTLQGARGERALLAYTSGIEFIVAFFGCTYAGVLPVPVVPPRRGVMRAATHSIAKSCLPRFAFASPDALGALAHMLPATPQLRTVEECLAIGSAADPITLDGSDLAFLQYTSGSTSAPKGVMVSHGNLRANLNTLRMSTAATRESIYVCWLPLFHDMGLVWNALEPVYLGAEAILMEPVTFVHHPLVWLQTISRYRGEISGGPNFAYDLLMAKFRSVEAEGLDLSSWRFAYNAAEPVRAETIEAFVKTYAPYGFSRSHMHAAYGMAEATLMISGGPPGRGAVVTPASRAALAFHRLERPVNDRDRTTIVGSGMSDPVQEVVIVDPETRLALAPGNIGEIWVRGPHVAQGYYQNAEATESTFRAFLADTGKGPFLRTGDLGLVHEGEIYVTGRLKDMLIIRGQNYYPQDLERTLEGAHRALRKSFSAVFLTDDEQEKLLVAVAEVEREAGPSTSTQELEGAIRAAVVAEHDLMVNVVVLIRHGTLAKTSSGKVQRRLMRELFRSGKLVVWTQEQPRQGEGL